VQAVCLNSIHNDFIIRLGVANWTAAAAVVKYKYCGTEIARAAPFFVVLLLDRGAPSERGVGDRNGCSGGGDAT
jgi:hypothetical protein